jgi:hypothetical protein
MASGTTLLLALYYRDNNSNTVTVASTNITFTPTVFPTTTHYIDQTVRVPTVKNNDAWAGQKIGILMMSTVAPELSGGYWDLDNVRLTARAGGLAVQPSWVNGQFQLTMQSDPGLKLEVLATTNVVSAVSVWSSLGTLTNATGVATFADQTSTNSTSRFYIVRPAP